MSSRFEVLTTVMIKIQDLPEDLYLQIFLNYALAVDEQLTGCVVKHPSVAVQ
jgi:hypothetical protein